MSVRRETSAASRLRSPALAVPRRIPVRPMSPDGGRPLSRPTPEKDPEERPFARISGPCRSGRALRRSIPRQEPRNRLDSPATDRCAKEIFRITPDASAPPDRRSRPRSMPTAPSPDVSRPSVSPATARLRGTLRREARMDSAGCRRSRDRDGIPPNPSPAAKKPPRPNGCHSNGLDFKSIGYVRESAFFLRPSLDGTAEAN